MGIRLAPRWRCQYISRNSIHRLRATIARRQIHRNPTSRIQTRECSGDYLEYQIRTPRSLGNLSNLGQKWKVETITHRCSMRRHRPHEEKQYQCQPCRKYSKKSHTRKNLWLKNTYTDSGFGRFRGFWYIRRNLRIDKQNHRDTHISLRGRKRLYSHVFQPRVIMYDPV